MSLPRYSAYRESEVPWATWLPTHWSVESARRLFSQQRDPSLPGDEQLSATQKYGVVPQRLFMELEDQKVALALSGVSGFKRVSEGEFVISLRSFQGGIEYSAYSGCVSPAYTVLRPNQAVEPAYYRYLLKSDGFIAALQSMTDGLRDGKAVSYQQFGQLRLPVPPLNEQRPVAMFLDRETAKIDSLIAEQERLIELLQEKRQAVISHAVTKGLNPDVPMKSSGVEWLGDVPAHWEGGAIRHFVTILRGKFTHRPRNDPAFYDGEFPFMQTGDITGASRYIRSFRQTLNERGASVSKEFPKGTLVMAIAANIGDVAILDFPAYFPDSIVGLIPKSKITLMYLYYLMIALKQPMLRNATISTQMNINVDQIGSLGVILPPLHEQMQVVDFLERQLDQLDEMAAQSTLAIELLKERRSALISAAVTGQVDVRGLVEQVAA